MFNLEIWLFMITGWTLVPKIFPQQIQKTPYEKGVMCNIEVHRTFSNRVINGFFCVPESDCRNHGVTRFPLTKYKDACHRYMSHPENKHLVCCHQADIPSADEYLDRAFYWAAAKYIPGLRANLMCKDHTHAICGRGGSYCNMETQSKKFQGLPTKITSYPHTALIGYSLDQMMTWNWFCLGTVISSRFILTSASCDKDNETLSTHVKVGEARICPVQHCPNQYEEQTLKIVTKHSKTVSRETAFIDLALYEVDPFIRFNQFVRPACLQTDQALRPSLGWFAHYGEHSIKVDTRPGDSPFFVYRPPQEVIAFKVKAAEDVVITLSKSGLPYVHEMYIEIVLGQDGNSRSVMNHRTAKEVVTAATPHLLSETQFRGFWIHLNPPFIRVGKEDSIEPFLSLEESRYRNVDYLPALGLSTLKGSGEWMFSDYRAMSSLHDVQLEVKYKEDCYFLPPNTLLTPHMFNDFTFCAGHLQVGDKPCDHDWGASLVEKHDDTFCMWHVFGVMLKDASRGCSQDASLAAFNGVAFFIDWIEKIAFSNFTMAAINPADRPECTVSEVLDTRGRC